MCFPFGFLPSSGFTCCPLGSLSDSSFCLVFFLCQLLLASLLFISPLLFVAFLLWLLPFSFLPLLSPQLHLRFLRLLLLVFLWLLQFVRWPLPLVCATLSTPWLLQLPLFVPCLFSFAIWLCCFVFFSPFLCSSSRCAFSLHSCRLFCFSFCLCFFSRYCCLLVFASDCFFFSSPLFLDGPYPFSGSPRGFAGLCCSAISSRFFSSSLGSYLPLCSPVPPSSLVSSGAPGVPPSVPGISVLGGVPHLPYLALFSTFLVPLVPWIPAVMRCCILGSMTLQ